MPSLPSFLIATALASMSSNEMRTFDDYPETKVEYYRVSATNALDLHRQMRRYGPSNDRRARAAARAYYTFDISYSGRGPKLCNARVTLRTRILFPRHSNPAALSPALRLEWTRYIRDLEHHELGHIELAYQTLPKLIDTIESGDCRSASRRTDSINAMLQRQQEAFDADPDNRVRALRNDLPAMTGEPPAR